jgi:hypothetical protein
VEAKEMNRDWIVIFEDPKLGYEVFTGEDAEKTAKARFRALLLNWNCKLFCEWALEDDPR